MKNSNISFRLYWLNLVSVWARIDWWKSGVPRIVLVIGVLFVIISMFIGSPIDDGELFIVFR